jgi:hypothetical protein
MTSFLPGTPFLSKRLTSLINRSVVVERVSPQTVGSTPHLQAFTHMVMNGNPAQVVGIFVPGGFSHSIVQQPTDQPVYVSTNPDQVTQYGLPAKFGAVGLLAHNNLAGGDFYQLAIGQRFLLVYGDGSVRSFTVRSIEKYRALDPENPYSNFVDALSPGPQISSNDLFQRIYTKNGNVVFQTCIDADGDPSWGRMFITAQPDAIPAFAPQSHPSLAVFHPVG